MKNISWGLLLIIITSSDGVMAHGTSLEEVSVIGRKTNLVGRAISASEGRISQEELAARPMLRTGEVMEAVPGMVATQHSGSGKANQYFLRGFNLDHGTDFASFIDAMPINLRSHGHGQGYTDLNFIIPELLGEIEYKKGSYYADVGDFSGTGSAHLKTASQLPSNNLALGIGEYSFGRVLFTGGRTYTENTIIYGFEHQAYSGPWDDVDENVGKTNLWLKQELGSRRNKVSLTFMAYNNDWNSADQIPMRAVEWGVISELGSIDTSLGGRSSRYSLSGAWNKISSISQVAANIYAIQYDLDLWSNFTYFTSPSGDQFQQVDSRVIYGGDIRYSTQGHLFDNDITNTVGFETRVDDIGEVGLYKSKQRSQIGVLRADAVKQYSASSFWEGAVQWTYNFRSVFGIRYDYFNFDVSPISAAVPSTLDKNAGAAHDDIVTSSLSLIYSFNDNYEMYISAGQGFHSNDARGTTIQQNPVSGELISKVDPLVSTFGYEVGTRVFIADKISASSALWYLTIDSELLFVGDEGVTEDTGVGSSRKGLEATLYYSMNNRWAFDFEYAYTIARLDDTVDGSNKIPGALGSVLSAGIHTQYSNKFYSHLRFRHFGDYSLDGGTVADSSTLVNLRLGYMLMDDKVNITLDVLNLLDSNDHDVEYFYASQLMDEPEPVNDRHYHVFEPRTIRVYFEYSF